MVADNQQNTAITQHGGCQQQRDRKTCQRKRREVEEKSYTSNGFQGRSKVTQILSIVIPYQSRSEKLKLQPGSDYREPSSRHVYIDQINPSLNSLAQQAFSVTPLEQEKL